MGEKEEGDRTESGRNRDRRREGRGETAGRGDRRDIKGEG